MEWNHRKLGRHLGSEIRCQRPGRSEKTPIPLQSAEKRSSQPTQCLKTLQSTFPHFFLSYGVRDSLEGTALWSLATAWRPWEWLKCCRGTIPKTQQLFLKSLLFKQGQVVYSRGSKILAIGAMLCFEISDVLNWKDFKEGETKFVRIKIQSCRQQN